MNKLVIAISFFFILSTTFASELWLPDGFSWDDRYTSVLNEFSDTYEMPPSETEDGVYTGILAGETPVGYMFTFCNGKLIGVSVAHEVNSSTPSVSDINNDEGYTSTYMSKSGNWTIIESGLTGYHVINWENGLGIRIPTNN